MPENDIQGPVSRPVPVELKSTGSVQREVWNVAEEVPVALIYNGTPYAVMMATPADLLDFAYGFTLSEEVVNDVSAIQEVLVDTVEEGVRMFISVDEDKSGAGLQVERTIAGRTSCGLCGMAELKEAIRYRDQKVKRDSVPTVEAFQTGFTAFSNAQDLFQENRSVHGAAFCDFDGGLLLLREDIGRHNALDKLLGAISQSDLDPANGFVLMSSRCSFELVKKSIVFGVAGLVSMSAPTAIALDLARNANMFLASRRSKEEFAFYLE